MDYVSPLQIFSNNALFVIPTLPKFTQLVQSLIYMVIVHNLVSFIQFDSMYSSLGK